MGRRKKNRIEMSLPVRIFGLDSTGKPFTLSTQTLDVNRSGARLGGVRGKVALGDVIGLQYKQQKARCKVVWLGQAGSPKQDQIAVECLERDRIPWAPELPDDRAVDQFDHHRARKQELRWHQRFTCHGGAGVLAPGEPAMTWAVLTDLSMRGCYLQTNTPLPVGARPHLTIRVEDHEVQTQAVVRTSNRTLGMGLEFVELSPPNKVRLEHAIKRLLGASKQVAEEHHSDRHKERHMHDWQD